MLAEPAQRVSDTLAVSWWLRAEGLAVLIVAVTIYAQLESGWLLFAVLFLVPDIGMAGYLHSPVVGAWTYNLLHNYLGPALMIGIGYLVGTPLLPALGLIWVAHIGFDRMLGYGLKLPTGFHDTHLGSVRGRRYG